MEEDETHLRKIDALEILNSVQERLLSQFPKKKISLSIDSDADKVMVNVNDLLFDIFENILNNAVKHNFNETLKS